jgi:hypothetical protein
MARVRGPDGRPARIPIRRPGATRISHDRLFARRATVWPAPRQPHLIDLGKGNGAQERTRTFTAVKPLAPEASASTNSATWARAG